MNVWLSRSISSRPVSQHVAYPQPAGRAHVHVHCIRLGPLGSPAKAPALAPANCFHGSPGHAGDASDAEEVMGQAAQELSQGTALGQKILGMLGEVLTRQSGIDQRLADMTEGLTEVKRGLTSVDAHVAANAATSGMLVEELVSRSLVNARGASYASSICVNDLRTAAVVVLALLGKSTLKDAAACAMMGDQAERLLCAALDEHKAYQQALLALSAAVRKRLGPSVQQGVSPSGEPSGSAPTTATATTSNVPTLINALQDAAACKDWGVVRTTLGRLVACQDLSSLHPRMALLLQYASATAKGEPELRGLLQRAAKKFNDNSLLVLLLTTGPTVSAVDPGCDKAAAVTQLELELGVTHLQLDALGSCDVCEEEPGRFDVEAAEIKTKRDGQQQAALRARCLTRLLAAGTGMPLERFKPGAVVYYVREADYDESHSSPDAPAKIVDGVPVSTRLLVRGSIYGD